MNNTDLITELCMILQKHDIYTDEVKAEITITLSNYDVQKKTTEVVVYDCNNYNYEMIKSFLIGKTVAGLTPKSLNQYKYQLTKILDKIDKPINMITADDLKLYFAIRQVRDNVSACTITSEWHILSSFFGWIHKQDLLAKNPMFKIECPKKRKKKKKAFSNMDCELLRNACKNLKEKAIIEVLLSTWCRVSEISNIDILDIEGDTITVLGKGKKERAVYLNCKAQLAIKNYLESRNDNNNALFVNRANERLSAQSIERLIAKIGERAGIENTHPHRFRRTGATMALRTGMPIEKVSYLLGHESVVTTQIYLDINEDEVKQAHMKYVS